MIHFCTADPLQVISLRLIALLQQSVTKLAGQEVVTGYRIRRSDVALARIEILQPNSVCA